MMIYKFYESSIDEPPSRPSPLSAYAYKLFHGPDYSLVKYSIGHIFDFLKGIKQVCSVFLREDAPLNLNKLLEKASVLIERYQFQIVF